MRNAKCAILLILLIHLLLLPALVSAQAWPNEPVDGTVLSDHPFTTKCGNGWVCTFPNGGAILTDPSAPISPPNIYQRIWPHNAATGDEAVPNLSLGNVNSVWMGFWWKPSNPFRGWSNQHNKQHFTWTGAGFAVMEFFGPQYGPFNLGYQLTQPASVNNCHIGFGAPGECHVRNIFGNVSAGIVALGQWQRVEACLTKSTTQSSANGKMMWWLGGVLVGNLTNVNFEGPFTLSQFTSSWDSRECVGCPDVDYHHMDHVRVKVNVTCGTTGGGGGTGDQDGDGVPDASDACPTQPGPVSNNGCPVSQPDQDGDGIPDASDQCPTVAGVAPSGCPPAGSPGTVNTLALTALSTTSLQVSFTTVMDGNNNPAKYFIRYSVAPINWGSAPTVSSGTCITPYEPGTIGQTTTCTITGLQPNTPYEVQLVAYRGTLNVDAVFGGLSNIASATTLNTNEPQITNFSPASGIEGTVVTITGTNFIASLSANTVKLNGLTCTVTQATTTQLTVTVPNGATTGTFSVQNSNGLVTSAQNFTVNPTIPVESCGCS